MANKQLVSLQFPDLNDTYTINGLPSGGSSGQVLAKSSGTDYAVGWVTPSAGVSPYTSNPAMDGTASAGSSANYSRGDHVHPHDTAKLDAPSGGSVGQVLKKTANGTEWANESGGGGASVTEVTVSAAGAVTQALDACKIYHFTGALTSLTITLNAPASGTLAHYHFDFNSGSTAPTLTLPSGVTIPSGFAVEASKHYEIDILNGYGAVIGW